MELGTILFISYSLYIAALVIVLLLDNRSSQSTIAWILVFIFLPIIGLFIYMLIGRNWRRLSRKRKIARQENSQRIVDNLSNLIKREPAEIKLLEEKQEYSYKKNLLHLLRNNSNSVLTASNNVEVLQTGELKFKKLIEDIKKAKKFIHLEYFIIHDDILGEKIKKELIKKSKEGVEVRVLYDALGSFYLPHKYKRELRQAGVKIYAYFNFLLPLRFHTLNYRNHRKIAIIDGNIGYIGGMNIAQEYIDGGDRFKSWRDTHLRVRGDVVNLLQGIFAISWYNTTREKLFGSKYFPMGRQFDAKVPVQVTTSGPDSEWESIKQLYFTLISSAEKKVYIQSPYFIPDPSVEVALKVAALSGIDVRVMTTGVPDKYLPYWAAFTYYEDLLRAGVKIYHYMPGFLHSKTVVVDEEVCSVGTANMVVRSFEFDYEVNTLIYDTGIASQLDNDFMEDLKNCKEIKIEDLRNLNVFAKLRNSLARLFAPLL